MVHLIKIQDNTTHLTLLFVLSFSLLVYFPTIFSLSPSLSIFISLSLVFSSSISLSPALSLHSIDLHNVHSLHPSLVFHPLALIQSSFLSLSMSESNNQKHCHYFILYFYLEHKNYLPPMNFFFSFLLSRPHPEWNNWGKKEASQLPIFSPTLCLWQLFHNILECTLVDHHLAPPLTSTISLLVLYLHKILEVKRKWRGVVNACEVQSSVHTPCYQVKGTITYIN